MVQPRREPLTAPLKRRLTFAPPEEGECLSVSIGRDERGFPVDALVVRDGARLCAYVNICKHIAIPLDAGTGDFLDDEAHLVCITHGALYRISDGLCVAGPCEGESLDQVVVEEDADGAHLVLEARFQEP